MFAEVFKTFNEATESHNPNARLTNVKKNILVYLKAPEIKDEFNTNNVYDHMEREFVSNVTLENYDKFTEYMENPTKKFDEYVSQIKKELIDDYLN